MESKPIQKFGMARLFAHASKVFQGLDDAGSKKLFPVAIDRDAGGQRLTGEKNHLRG